MNYKKEMKKMGWSSKEVTNRMDSMAEEYSDNSVSDKYKDVEKSLKNGDENVLLNEFFNIKK
ncbi:hypothetical protein [Staphylococcus kloosii]|uniref:hypothetical protein n=1 Tax=Staphylococcus kloosii TaxID=29384 RepID=UPI0028A3A4A0|nr:hypothetical protein [Staphylococcus kloosii]MDT3958408.1 hypothetical protein [Staphylococcus kloosii]